jgi:hypothetical protein
VAEKTPEWVGVSVGQWQLSFLIVALQTQFVRLFFAFYLMKWLMHVISGKRRGGLLGGQIEKDEQPNAGRDE